MKSDKFDLIMWTYNSSKFLGIVLERINSVIPQKFVNQKIIIDGGSHDNTEDITNSLGWKFFRCKKGIPYQANMGLELVETDRFCSFEHDVLLSSDWIDFLINPLYQKFAVVQGVRFSVNPILNILERESVKRNKKNYTSLDNNVLNTKIIRDIGGFNEKMIFSVDTELLDRISSYGYKWIVVDSVESVHLKNSLKETARHFQRHKLIDNYKVTNKFLENLGRLALSFPYGCYLAVKYRLPLASLGFVYWRLVKMQTACKLVCKS